MTKIAINTCYGGFSLSERASNLLNEKMNLKPGDELHINPKFGHWYGSRYHPKLIEVIEELGEDASGGMSVILITEVPGHQYRIEEYDGMERIVTPDSQTWDIIDTPENREEYPEAFL